MINIKDKIKNKKFHMPKLETRLYDNNLIVKRIKNKNFLKFIIAGFVFLIISFIFRTSIFIDFFSLFSFLIVFAFIVKKYSLKDNNRVLLLLSSIFFVLSYYYVYLLLVIFAFVDYESIVKIRKKEVKADGINYENYVYIGIEDTSKMNYSFESPYTEDVYSYLFNMKFDIWHTNYAILENSLDKYKLSILASKLEKDNIKINIPKETKERIMSKRKELLTYITYLKKKYNYDTFNTKTKELFKLIENNKSLEELPEYQSKEYKNFEKDVINDIDSIIALSKNIFKIRSKYKIKKLILFKFKDNKDIIIYEIIPNYDIGKEKFIEKYKENIKDFEPIKYNIELPDLELDEEEEEKLKDEIEKDDNYEQ
ncbi:MAG: hypothetical protein QXU98_08520 [Candidatus Parvarchaeota archaeon]